MRQIHIQLKNHTIKNNTFFVAISVIALVVVILRCSTNEGITGTGSQSGNGRISCVIYNDNGSFASGARVRLRSHDYILGEQPEKNLASFRDTFTNSKGEFRINSVDRGQYCIEINDGKANAILLMCEISRMDTVVQLPNARLLPTGTIKGSCTTAPGDSSELFIQVYGLERSGVRDKETGEFVIGDIPAGNYTIRIISTSTEYSPVQIPHITIDPNETEDLGNYDLDLLSKWRMSKDIYLNTTSSGADITETVTDIPLLVRLGDENFNFNEANSDGSDIRFTKYDGVPVPFEIERWDAEKHEAEVWVKVDTVYGNDSTQCLKMYWGNEDASGNSNSRTVFDTTDGFKSAWHFGNDTRTILDVTANNYNGTKMDNLRSVKGCIGFSEFFDGSGDYADMGNVCNPDMSNFSVSGWIKKSDEKKISTIISKSSGGKASSSYGWLLQLDADGALAIYIATGDGVWADPGTFVLTSRAWITDTAWHHVAAVINRSDRNDCHLYIDGVDVSTYPTAGDIKNISTIRNELPLRIGSDANGNYQWNGSMDEITISSRIFSHEYIKLMYMNQRSEDNAVVFTR